jgi:putative CocE/NonD family hydrolase
MNVRRFRAAVFTAACFLALAVSLRAQNLEYTNANYTKYERYIPMRDGVRLFTAVYAPKDSSKPYPIMLVRTPYSIPPYGSDRYRDTVGPSFVFEKEGYIFVYQDVRGRWMSEGKFDQVRPYKPVKSGPKDFDETTDTWDTIEWLLKNIPNNNGRVGMWGISYPGFYAIAGLIDSHPALKAVSPQAPVADWFSSDDWHHNGAFLLAHAFG